MLQWLAEHVPASISVASNVPGNEAAQYFVTDDEGPAKLVREFVRYLYDISKTSHALLNE